MLTERNWRRYAIETFNGLFPLDEKFDECRGSNSLGLVFKLAGMDGSSPDHFSTLAVDAKGVVRDHGSQGYGARVGRLVSMGMDDGQ